jgi:hypothetical protein
MNPLPIKPFAKLLLATSLCLSAPPVFAVEWVNVTANPVGDRFFIDKSSVQRKDSNVWYWEYREFPQANNAFLEEAVDQPVHGVVLSWSANCTSKTQRLRQVTAYNKERAVIRRFTYGDTGTLHQPAPESSAGKVLKSVCDLK